MGMTANEMPPDSTSNQAVGQQTAPSTIVPHNPELTSGAGSSSNTNNLALVSLITGILSYLGHVIPFIGGTVLAVVAIATGYMALQQIKETGEQGRAMAIIGIILGIANVALVALLVLVVLFAVFVLGIGVLGYFARQG